MQVLDSLWGAEALASPSVGSEKEKLHKTLCLLHVYYDKNIKGLSRVQGFFSCDKGQISFYVCNPFQEGFFVPRNSIVGKEGSCLVAG